MNQFLAASIFFICSLENFGSIRYAMLLPMLFVSFFIILISYDFKLTKINVISFSGISLITLVLGGMGYFETLTYISNINYTFFEFLSATIFKIVTVFVCIELVIRNINKIKNIVDITISIHALFFLIQFFLVYTTGYYPDPLSVLFDDPQRFGSGFSIPIIGDIYRPTGFYEEPSTYSSFMLLFISLRFILCNKIDRYIIIGLTTMLLSLSAAAIIYGGLVALYLVFTRGKPIFKTLFLLGTPFLIAIFTFFIFTRLNAVSDASSIRMNLIITVFTQPIDVILFGNGILGVPDALAEYIINNNLFKAGVSSLNDNGLWLFIIIKFGVVGLLLLVLLVFRSNIKPISKFMFVCLLITKLSFLYFSFFYYLFFIFYFKDNKDNKDNYG
ncbi:TPA: hypothetical protein KDY59_000641 [Vibrio parahaemolyticus]|nr:hypothetical protein [Vibrio parahaemolyticus]